MTWALCFNCGEVKFGAICPCPKCAVASTGKIELDIAFSDHHLEKETLKEFGAVVVAIHSASDEPDLCFWTFMHYVSTKHSSILQIKLEPEMQSRVESLLATIELPPVTLRDSAQIRHAKEAKASSGNSAGKRWWQFWK